MDRAIEFLNSKGIQIAPRPTTRLSNEVYELLLYEFQKDGIAKIRSRELSVHKISDWIRNIDRESIELIQKIADGKEKLAILQRNIKEENKTSNQEIVFMPDFSLTDFNEEFLTIDAVISKVLPKYLVETPNKKFKSTDENIELQRAFVLGEKLIQILNFSIEHLSPNRNLQTRLYINNDTTSDINELIYEHSKTPIDKRSKAAKFLKYWMNEFDIGSDFRIKSFEGMASQIEIHFEDEWYNIVDKGFGAGQIFSILLKIALSINLKENELRTITKKLRRKGFDEFLLTHIMEEPEANLHPALQSKLADLFYEAYKEFDIKFILETHSEYILRKSQIHVKELNQQDDKLDKLPFGVFYFDKESGPYKMEYRKDGKFINEFGSGFFDVSTNLAFDIL